MRLVLSILLLALALPAFAAKDAFTIEGELPRGYGYLVVDSDIARTVTNWHLSNGLTIDRLPLGQQTTLLRLPEGRYRWTSISVPYFNLPHEIDTGSSRQWQFTVARDVINYSGTLIVAEDRATDAAGVRFVNRSSEIVGRLRIKYPVLLKRYGLRFAGSYRDDFFTLIGEGDEYAQSN